MGKIIRNGIEFSGACEDATAVNYNNSLSGLEAQTVQEGIDELSIKQINEACVSGVDGTASDLCRAVIIQDKIATFYVEFTANQDTDNELINFHRKLGRAAVGNSFITLRDAIDGTYGTFFRSEYGISSLGSTFKTGHIYTGTFTIILL